MERNAIIATVLVILILLGYQWYMSRFEVPVPKDGTSVLRYRVRARW